MQFLFAPVIISDASTFSCILNKAWKNYCPTFSQQTEDA